MVLETKYFSNPLNLWLQYQRQLALQKMQEQEAEMKLRQEQAKQQYMMQMQHQQQAYAAAQQGMMQPPGAPGMPPYGQPYPPPMHYPPYMGQPGKKKHLSFHHGTSKTRVRL